MKDIALQVASQAGEHKLNVLRDILFLIQKAGMTLSLNFVGGTSLRFLYRIRRYSEDLDFSVTEKWNPSKFFIYTSKIKHELKRAGYSCSFTIKEEKTVQRLTIRFEDLLFELGLSSRKNQKLPNQKLPINIEIDTNPPQGWKSEKSIVNIHLPVLIQHYNKASLFAAKVTAWFRSKWKDLKPNFALLNNGLIQVNALRNKVTLNEENWLGVLEDKVESLKWKEVISDVRPFLENPDDLITFNKENILLLLSEKS